MKTQPAFRSKHYLALCGGVGGAKLALGLSHALAPEQLTIVVNTGDDFEHLGLSICPDVDTVTYTLAGLVQPSHGWGRDAESFAVLDTVERLGGETWFRLGDKDIGLHLMRRMMLDQGNSLSTVTKYISHQFGIAHEIAPMTDGKVRTMLQTAGGLIPFQEYFVKERCRPALAGIQYIGTDCSTASAALTQALANSDLAGVILCPSNPYLSIDPILALPGVRQMLVDVDAPVVAVAPIVSGAAIKGPAAKIMRELGIEPSAAAVGLHYADFLDGYIVDTADALTVDMLPVLACDIVMKTLDDKIQLARRCIAFTDELA